MLEATQQTASLPIMARLLKVDAPPLEDGCTVQLQAVPRPGELIDLTEIGEGKTRVNTTWLVMAVCHAVVAAADFVEAGAVGSHEIVLMVQSAESGRIWKKTASTAPDAS